MVQKNVNFSQDQINENIDIQDSNQQVNQPVAQRQVAQEDSKNMENDQSQNQNPLKRSLNNSTRMQIEEVSNLNQENQNSRFSNQLNKSINTLLLQFQSFQGKEKDILQMLPLFRQLKDCIYFLTNEICQFIFQKYEPDQKLNQLNYILEAHFEDVWILINLPIKLLEQQPEQESDQLQQTYQQLLQEYQDTQNVDNQIQEQQANKPNQVILEDTLKANFYSQVLGNITNLMLNEVSVQKSQYMCEILSLFHIVISKYLARDPTCALLLDVSSNIFCWEKSFHQVVLPKYKTQELKKSFDIYQFDQEYSTQLKRVKQEQEWRNTSLKIGMKLDVIKEIRVNNMFVSGWTRGVITDVSYQNEEQDQFNQYNEQSKNDVEFGQIDAILIKYEQDLDASSIQLNRQDWRFAPLNTFTQDYEWRYSLQPGDNVDCMDNEKDWYKSTVLKFRNQTNRDKEKVQEIYVGYRHYHPEGSKLDDEGNKFFGWSDRYDNWISIGDIRVQKFHSLHQQYIKVEQQNKQYSKLLDFDDRTDIISSNDKPAYYSSPRLSYFSKFEIISDAINIFGTQNGFEAIINNLNDAAIGKIQLTLSTIYSYCLFLSQTMPLWHRQFCCNYIDRFNDSLLKCLCYVNTEANDQNKSQLNLGPIQNDNFSSGLLEDMINKLVDPIWKRHNTIEMTQKILSSYQVGIGSALLSLSKLERRIQGLKYVNQAIATVRQPYPIHKLITTRELIESLRNFKIIDQIFGVRTHFELVHRSQDLIRLLFNEKEELLDYEIDMIWNVCVKQGEQIKLEIYNNILEVIRPAYGNLTDKTKAIFISKIESIQSNQLIEKDVQLLYELSKKTGINFQKPEEFVIKAVNLMWSIAVLEKDYPIQLIKVARKNFQELISQLEDAYKENYIAQCIDNITNNKMPLQNLKILSKLIESLNQSKYSAAGRKTRQEFAQDLVETQDLIGIIIQDLDRFVEFSNSFIKKGEITQESYSTANVSQNHYFSYLKNIKSRLNRIMNILVFSKCKLQIQQIESIWDILVIKSEMKEKDQNEFFLWFKRLILKDDRRLMSEELMIELFRKKIVQGDFRMLKSLKITGLDCIVRLFVLVNELQGNVLDLDPNTQENNWNNQQYSGYGNNYNNNYRNNNNQDQYIQNAKTRFNRFRVNIMPQELEGINVLWSMMEAIDTSNYNLFLMVQRTLINIYSNLSSLLADKRNQINDCFMIECMKCLESINKNNFVIRNEKEKRDSLTFICKTVTTFLEGTEQYGVGNLKIQRQLEQTQYAQKLMFEIKIPIKRGIDASYIELNTYLNMSLWELKQLIAKNIDASPLCISLKRMDTKKPEFKDFNNLKLLSDLNISDNETFQVIKAKIPDIQQVPLIDKRGKMVPELANILQIWFNEFSIEKTKQLIIEEIIQIYRVQQNSNDFKNQLEQKLAEIPDTVRVMTPQKCCQFIEKITQIKYISIDDYRVLNLFNNYSKNIGFGNILQDEFMTFYEEQAKNKPDAVKNNLNFRGIQSDLKEKLDLSNLNWDNDKRIIKDEKVLPRYKLSQDEGLFKNLINLVENSQCDEQDGMWLLLMNIQTNKEIEDKILDVDDMDYLFDLKNKNYDNNQFENQDNNFKFHKILYILQIVQSLINEYKKKNECYATIYLEENEVNNIIYQNKNVQNQSPKNQQEESYWQLDEEKHSKSEEKQKTNKMDADPTDTYDQNFPSLDDSNQIKENKSKNQNRDKSNEPMDRNPKNQSQTLDPQQAIALPYNGPLLPGSANSQLVQNNYDVPIAPASQAALIGPPNSQNTYNYQKSSIQNFKGIQVKQIINCSTAQSDEEIAKRKNWLPKFLKSGGMEKLISLLRNLSHIHRQVESSKKEQQKYVNEKIIKRCLKEVLECIKVLIVSQLSAQSDDDSISINLTRKMSISNQQVEDKSQNQQNEQLKNDVEMIDESQETNKDLEINQMNKNDNNQSQDKNKKTKIQQEQQNTEEEMKPLIDLIKNNSNLIFNFKQQMDLENFQSEILGLISEFIDKKDIKFEDIEIVNQCLSIWLSCLVSEPKLLNLVYQEFYQSQQVEQSKEQEAAQNINSDKNIFHFSKTLVEKGLVSSEYRMREAFQNTIKFIVSSIKSNSLKLPPLDFFIQILISKFDYISQKIFAKQTRIFFSVLIEMLNKYFEEKQQNYLKIQNFQNQIGSQIGGQYQYQNQQELINSKQFLFETIQRLLNYESTEIRNSLMEDYTLIGFFDVIRIFIENSINSLSTQQFQELSYMLLEKCLFNMNFKPINQHILQNVDLQQYEKQQINKCLTKESTQACFNLLIKLCRFSQDKTLAFKILESYFLKLIQLVDKPALPGFSPSTNGRSFNNYSGIKNLGAVCYMNSMNQQFFNIPTLRYCLLATQDKIPENIVVPDLVPYKGMEIDDNVLHQMMKMFGFLELTDRQCYDPTQLCYSIKNFGEPTNVREQKDAQEYLNIMFDQLEQQLKNTSQKYLIQNVFGGQFCYKKKCKNCGNVRSSNEDMLNISLEVKNQKSIYEALRKFVQGEIIQDFNCEACNKRVDLEKQTSIQQLPNTLIIHLQRIIFDFDQLRNVKLNDRIEFPEILNMKEFMTSEIEKKEKIQQEQQQNQQNEILQNQNEEGKIDDGQQIVEQQNSNKQDQNILIEQSENQIQNQDVKSSNIDEEYEYRLVGVVDHMGSADAGHYLSFINVERDLDFHLHKKGQKISRDEFFATEKYTWLEFNDKIIQSFKVKDLETLCFGGQGNQNAYMLVYEKMLKRKMKIVIPKQIIDLIQNDALACDGTAITRDSSNLELQNQNLSLNLNNTEELTSSSSNIQNTQIGNSTLDIIKQNDFHLFYVFPDLLSQLNKQFIQSNTNGQPILPEIENDNQIGQLQEYQNLYFDKIKNEYIALLNFEDVRKFVPNDIYKVVHEDNKKFLSEKQVFSDAFFNSTLQLVEIALAQLNIQSEEPNINGKLFELVFNLVERVMFDLLANSQQISALKGMCETMNSMLQKSDPAVLYLVSKRIFIPQDKLMKDERNFFETLATHVNQEVREMASSVLLTVLNRLIYMNGIENENNVVSAIQEVLNQMDEECPKHWMRLDTYFNFIYELLKSNSVFLRIFLQNKIVSKLINLMNRYNPSSMVYMNACPPLDKLVLTLCTVLRFFPCLVDIYDLENIQYQDGLDKQTLILIQQNQRGISGKHLDIQQFYSQEQLQMDQVNQWLQLSDECLNSLFMKQKQLKTFLQNVTKNGYSISDFSHFIAHLCFKNKEYSYKIAKHILKGTNSSGADELQPFLLIMKEFLIINDELSDLRIEWIFGVPSMVMKQNNYQNYNQTPKIGVSFADQISSQVCKYFSPIYKTASTYYNRKDCALQALISNKRNQSKAVLLSLKTIFEAILEDKSKKILRYLKCMDPPTYQFARYWDWIKPWVISEIDNNTRNQNIQAYRNELEISIHVLSLIEEIEKIDKQSQQDPSSQSQNNSEFNQNTIIEYPENDNGPKPYLIWDIVGATIFDKKEDQRNKIVMWINQITCSVSKSFPTGENNLALLDQFNNNQNNYQYGQGASGGTGFLKSSSIGKLQKNQRNSQSNQASRRRHGNTKQGKSIQKQLRVNQVNENVKPLRYKKKEINLKKDMIQNTKNEDADSEEASGEDNQQWNPQSIITNQDQVTSYKNVRFAESQNEDENMNKDNHDIENQDNNEIQKIQKTPTATKKINIDQQSNDIDKKNEQEASVSVSESSESGDVINESKLYHSPNQNKDNQNQILKDNDQENQIQEQSDQNINQKEDVVDDIDENEEQDNQDSQQINENLDESYNENIEQYNSNCLICFKAENNSAFSQTVQLTLKPKKDQNGNEIPCNFKIPSSSILCEIVSGTNQNILQITKLDPKQEDWDQFDWDFQIIVKNKYQQNNQGINNNEAWNNSWAYEGDTGMNNYGNNDNMIDSSVKNCPTCTFENISTNIQCSMCGSNL